jgi:hypothetical protein
MRVLTIRWQRLVSGGRTCDRCGSTELELERAIKVLTDALRPLGIEPRLQVDEISQTAFALDPAESNRIWVAGKPLEDWITADVGSSQCCSVCGESECRTVEVGGDSYEVIPERLIVKAALQAASAMLGEDGDPKGP